MAQKVYSKSDVREMFPLNVKDLWINNLSGTVDNVHVIDMIIGTDGFTCKGLYTMRNSGETFFFEGKDTDHQLQLVELNSELRRSGFIFGKFDGEKLEGQWMDADKNLYLPMKLSFVNTFENFKPDKCKQQHWYRIFTSRAEGKNIKLHLIRDNLTFTAINYEDGRKMKDIIFGKGTRVEVLELGFKNSVFMGKSLVIDTTALDKISIVSLDENGYEVSTALKLDTYLDFECYEYADYHSRMVCTKPVMGNKKFDTWMESKFQKWMAQSIDELKEVKNTNVGTKDRWIQTVEGWVEIDLFLSDIISGTIYLQSSLRQGTGKIPFIYDIRSGKEIKLQDIFDNEFDANEYFKLVIPAKKKETEWKPEVKKWVSSQTFEHITLSDKGICFRTDFNTIYGEKEIVVLYSTVEHHLKNRNLLKEILVK